MLIRIGGEVDRASASLIIIGDDLDPDEVTKILKCEPSDAIRKGEKGRNNRPARTGRWSLDSPLEEACLDEQIRWLLDALPEDQAIWEYLWERYELVVFCGLFMDDWNRETILRSTTLAGMGRRGLRLDLDIYADSPTEEEPPESE